MEERCHKGVTTGIITHFPIQTRRAAIKNWLIVAITCIITYCDYHKTDEAHLQARIDSLLIMATFTMST